MSSTSRFIRSISRRRVSMPVRCAGSRRLGQQLDLPAQDRRAACAARATRRRRTRADARTRPRAGRACDRRSPQARSPRRCPTSPIRCERSPASTAEATAAMRRSGRVIRVASQAATASASDEARPHRPAGTCCAGPIARGRSARGGRRPGMSPPPPADHDRAAVDAKGACLLGVDVREAVRLAQQRWPVRARFAAGPRDLPPH